MYKSGSVLSFEDFELNTSETFRTLMALAEIMRRLDSLRDRDIRGSEVRNHRLTVTFVAVMFQWKRFNVPAVWSKERIEYAERIVPESRIMLRAPYCVAEVASE